MNITEPTLMDSNQITYAKRTLYYLLLQKSISQITPNEAEIILLLAKDSDIQSALDRPDQKLEDIYAPNR